VAIAAAVVALATSLAATFVVLDASGSAPPPHTHDNTLVRINPHTNAMERVIDVPPDPAATAAWGHTLWVYSIGADVVSEVDAGTNRALHTTKVPVTPPDLRPVAGPALAADSYGAWLVGIDRHGRSWLTHVLPSGRQHRIALPGSPEAVGTGLRAVWVIDHGARWDRLLRLDPATGTITGQTPLPARVDSLTVGYGYVWLVNSSTARLYRITPRLAASRPVDLACAAPGLYCVKSSAGRPSAMFGEVWVGLSANGGEKTVLINPSTLLRDHIFYAGGGGVEAFGSVWVNEVDDGEVVGWPPDALYPADHVISVTHPQYLGGSCLTSIAAAGGAVWVTLAPSASYVCNP
jgi:hypothetical protein